ncbi:four helix bundle protein [Robertmurraya yapensis]|uniref:Four helix bundle protein n=1 Tax=Bacillus yapensis TaxID=2492960 RepID=A0A431VSZ6_9BACI|nr:four helix bundle protein [Bacillus yapensis]RTR26281.1 four helix bundle protein [Bacillus yapensis]TKS93636.1 four helix bundle protein [Bacillus yapensis]
MNEKVRQIQQEYQKVRELSNYSIFDIESSLKDLAEKGFVWILKDLKEICEAEEILIEHYLNKFRSYQIYDNLEVNPYLQSSIETAAKPPSQSSLDFAPVQKEKQTKKQQHLEVRDVKRFIGYKKARELEKKVIELCQNFPSYEVDHIVNQIERSARSIKDSIEMGEQVYVGERFNQYSIAIGSAKETSAWLQMSLGQKYITQVQFDELDNLTTQVVRILTKNLSNIKEKEGKGMDLPNPFTPNVKNFGAYNNALLLVEKIYEITRKPEFWKEKNLVRKMRKRATSSVANIAEAHQLYISKKFRFFNDSMKALDGLDSLLETSLIKGIISEKELKEIVELRISIRNVLSTKMANISGEKAS